MDSGHMQRPLGMRDQNELADLNEIPVPRIIVNYQPNICLRSDSTAKPFAHCVCICEIPRTCVSFPNKLSQIIQGFDSRDFQVQ